MWLDSTATDRAKERRRRRTGVKRRLSGEVGADEQRRKQRARCIHMSHTVDDAWQCFHADGRQLRVTGRRWSRHDEQADCEQDDVGEIDVFKL